MNNKMNKKAIGTVAILVFVLGAGLIGAGNYLTNSLISADVEERPPTPEDPQTGTPPTPDIPVKSSLPPTPGDPSTFTFVKGWSMISGSKLYGYDLADFRDNGLALYSFNDPKYQNRDWAITYGTMEQCEQEQIGCDVINPQPPLGYYVYNGTGKEVNLRLVPKESTVVAKAIYGRGWHILHWGGDAISKQDLFKKISLEYSNGEKLTIAEAISMEEHKASIKVYSIVNENSIELSMKELGNENSATMINMIPKNSFFWIYLRRTSQKAVDVTVDDGTTKVDATTPLTSIEKQKIDAWLTENNLNECGDPVDTIYTGGSCLFDESTGQYRDKYQLVISKFPQRPWL